MAVCSQPECQTTAGCKCTPLTGTGAILPYMTHLMNDARETLQMRDKRIETLETALLKIREIALSASPAQAAEINEIAKTGFKGREG